MSNRSRGIFRPTANGKRAPPTSTLATVTTITPYGLDFQSAEAARQFVNDLIRQALANQAGQTPPQPDSLQPGVLQYSDGFVSISGSTATVQGGIAWVSSGTRILSRVGFGGASLGFFQSPTTRLDQIVLDSTGAISVLPGTDQPAVTLDNRNGAAVPQPNTIRLADILVTGSVLTMRDRRPWARGAKVIQSALGASASIAGGAWTAIGNLQARFESSGKPIIAFLTFGGVMGTGAPDLLAARLKLDGSVAGSEDTAYVANLNINQTFVFANITPSAGSHVAQFDIYLNSVGSTYNLGAGASMKILELVDPAWINNN